MDPNAHDETIPFPRELRRGRRPPSHDLAAVPGQAGGRRAGDGRRAGRDGRNGRRGEGGRGAGLNSQGAPAGKPQAAPATPKKKPPATGQPKSPATAPEKPLVFTNEDLAKYARPEDRQGDTAVAEKAQKDQAAFEADALKKAQQAPATEAYRAKLRRDAEERVKAAEARVEQLKRLALAEKNPFVAAPKLDEDQQKERDGLSAAERLKKTQDELAAAAAGARSRAREPAGGPAAAFAGQVMPAVLIVEDHDSLREMLRKTLEAAGHEVEEAADAARAISLVRSKRYLLVLTDLRLPRGDGHGVLQAAREADPELPVIVMTAYGTVEDAVAAMKAGALDFLGKPVDPDHLLLVVERALDRSRLRRENLILRSEFAERLGFPRIIGESAALQEVSRQIQRVAPTGATVLLQGESGTGKELFARAIHHLSDRREGPFVAINCAAIPDTLLENELFGHEKGAYTGANAARIGRVELAGGGTLFLDEIGDISPAVQSKLLRVLQERTFERVGGNRTIEVDLRVVAATNQDLRQSVAEKRFREDLFFRLSVVPILIPPLRDRREDIPLLVEAFVQRFRRELARPGLGLSEGALAALAAYPWPGNVRELENCIERAAIVADADLIQPSDLLLPGATAAPGS